MSGAAPRSLAIRPARTHDPVEVDRLYDICLRTGDSGRGAENLLQEPRLLGEVYLGAYLRFEPDLAFVLDGGDGAPLGYVLGARDTRTFEETLEERWWPSLREEYPPHTFPEGSLDEHLVELIHAHNRTDPEVVAQLPAHLHVDILPDGQGGGNGRRLLDTLFAALRGRGVRGIHLGVSPENTNAIGFYEHLGFRHVQGSFYGMPL